MDGKDGWHRTRLYVFWRRLTEGLSAQELWTQFRKETTSGLRSYAKGLPSRPDDVKKSDYNRHVLRELFWATLTKLSPVRRLLLLLAFLLWIAPVLGAPPLTAFYACVVLFVLLLLELADRVAMKRDMQIARDIQGWLLPHEAPTLAEAEIAFAAHPANTVAGDYYDVFFRRTSGAPEVAGPLFFAVADVAGKSVPAALLSATLQASLRTAAYDTASLPDLVSRLNTYACEHSLEGRRFTTAIFAELVPASGALSYVNAGHNPPMLKRARGDIETLEAGGLPLGVRSGTPYECRTLTLEPGDVLVLYTDGVVEAENESREEFGEERLRALVRGAGPAAPAELVERILRSVETFLGTAPQGDDITCFVVRYRGTPGP